MRLFNRKRYIYITTILTLTFFSIFCLSESSHDNHAATAFGDGKAITAVSNKGEKFQLSIKSETLLGIKTSPLKHKYKKGFDIPYDALIRYQNKIGVFVKKNGWFQLVELTSFDQHNNLVTIYSPLLETGVEIVISGVALLRIAHLQASGEGGKGHAH